jgi:putative transposase
MVRAERRWSSSKVISALADVMVIKGVPEHLRSDNGPEFVARDLREWLAKTGAKTLYIEPGSPWENDYCESFNSKLRDEFLNGEIFYSMKELRVLADRWRAHYNTVRPHSSLDTDHQHRRRGWPQAKRDMEKWKPLRAYHFSTPPTAVT